MNKVSLSNVIDQSITRGRRVDSGDKGDDDASSKENAKPNKIVVINPYRKNANGSHAATVRNPYKKAHATNVATCEKQPWVMANKKVHQNICICFCSRTSQRGQINTCSRNVNTLRARTVDTGR